ncbi:PD-(D/E)XK nuclease family protein [Aegicerativicinus sediminis]|uniref:PD-(D/E)XK nuclease family protein n=1 Tax=Aegicerativicinus sediminis TaxID=2893202 RepID=UPI001E4C38A7|nr:PD-(D/E)XK nuclease family protein [Aegicerativicinus sediminis]
MTNFIDLVIQDLIKREENLSNLKFVFPSRRAGLFLKKSLSKYIEKPIFSPRTQSIDEFVEELSGLKSITVENLYIQFYEVYKQQTPNKLIEEFDSVLGWVNTLLNDFNEIDRYLIDPDKIFNYLKDIKETEHWSIGEGQTEQIKAYLKFWSLLPKYYKGLNESLKEKELGYPGNIYREAVENLEYYIDSVAEDDIKHVFVGFNALNKAEERIIQEILNNRLGWIYWDIEESFLNNPLHDAGHFIRNYRNAWPYYQKNRDFHWTTNSYSIPKSIEITGVPKQIGQIKYAGELIQKLLIQNNSLEDTAIVLADETLLLPLLNSLPKDVGPINITMGIPLSTMPISDLFEILLIVQKQHKGTVYHRLLKQVLNHPLIHLLFENEILTKAVIEINKGNKTHLKVSEIMDLFPNDKNIPLLFDDWNGSIRLGLIKFQKLIFLIREQILKSNIQDNITLECLFRFHTIFNKIQGLIEPFEGFNNLSSLIGLYKELIKNETLDLKGEPLNGLQIMGMLESRVLDFRNVIIVSLNEGLLPAGKTDNSFIPYDVKRNLGLPTYKEKDAVYANHFYHLLYRSEKVHLIYNTDVDALKGGEKSRFISQLEFEGIHTLNHHTISHNTPAYPKELREIEKSEEILEALTDLATSGFSPTSLTSYIRNPLEFYYQKILKIDEFEDVEETMAANTMGTVIHHTLEELYKPYTNKILAIRDLESMVSKIPETVMIQFKKHYLDSKHLYGKNLIILEICKRYISNYLKKEQKSIEEGHKIQIVALEEPVEMILTIPSLGFPVKIKGYIDRIDLCDGVYRIIDYKTGKVTQTQLHIKLWDDITTDYNRYSKPFQILCYALMVNHKFAINQMEGGIISFKNLGGDYFLKFGKADEDKPTLKDYLITEETLKNFKNQLENLILEILNPDINLVEKNI